MESSKVDMFIGFNIENFFAQDLVVVRAELEKLSDDKIFMLQGIEFQKPSTILLIAVLLGWERFWLDDIALGILKVLTCYGCLVWWLIDIFSARDRAKRYNFNKFMEMVSII